MTKKYNNTLSAIIVISLIALTAVVWWNIISSSAASRVARAYFLDVGEGDSELVVFPGNIKVMTDAGPDDSVLASIEKVMPSGDDYIDLAVISHPQLDHFNGFYYLLDHYHIGAFIWNGRDDTATVTEWPALLAKIRSKNIPIITLAAGDSVHYKKNEIDILSPDPGFAASAELNDTVLVELVKTEGFRALLTADIGFNVEDHLVAQGINLGADILKVAHHGSKFASGDAFLRAVNPKIAVIEVGAKNKYGHPAKETLARIASSTNAAIFRTDENGTIAISADSGKLEIVKEK
jgi:competence protein ComEC